MAWTRYASRTVVFALFLLLATGAWGEVSYVTNDTGYTIYVRSDGATYRQSPAGGLLPVHGVDILEGFAYVRGSFQVPTFRLSLGDAGEGEIASLTEDDLTSGESADPTVIADIIAGPRLDNQYLEWIGLEPVVARARGRMPLGSYTDSGSGRASLPLGESLLWERAGTDLEWLKTSPKGLDLFIAASAYSASARSTTIFLFVYEPGTRLPLASIEIPFGISPSLVLVWTPVLPEPIVAGNAVASEFFVEAQIWMDMVQNQLGKVPEDAVIEVATASSATGIWEEFVLARFPLSAVIDQ